MAEPGNVPITDAEAIVRDIATDPLDTGEDVQYVKIMDGTPGGTQVAAVGWDGLKTEDASVRRLAEEMYLLTLEQNMNIVLSQSRGNNYGFEIR
jgi:hypothetical protein